MISAHEARNLNRTLAIEVDLKVIDGIVRAAASAGLFNARMPYDLVFVQGYGAAFKNQCVEDRLIELGYSVNIQYEEGQFVDVWLEISWSVG